MSQEIKCLTPQEEERFLETLRKRKDAERAYMLYHLMLVTGLRLSEALSLNVEHAAKTKVEIKVKSWSKEGEKKERFKAVYFPKVLQEHLRGYLKYKARQKESLLPDAALFVSKQGTRISPRQVERDFKKWLKESGIESNLSPHSLRHTVGTRLLKEFKNAKLVQRYLGHSDVATTLRYYVDVFPEDLEEAAEMLAEK
jgi:integrase